MAVRKPGQIVVFRFPQTNLNKGKLRPALLLAPVPGKYEDWLCCMISTKLYHAITGFDEIIDKNSPDFNACGLKISSVVRVARLAVVTGEVLVGTLGEISFERFKCIQDNLASWIHGKTQT